VEEEAEASETSSGSEAAGDGGGHGAAAVATPLGAHLPAVATSARSSRKRPSAAEAPVFDF